MAITNYANGTAITLYGSLGESSGQEDEYWQSTVRCLPVGDHSIARDVILPRLDSFYALSTSRMNSKSKLVGIKVFDFEGPSASPADTYVLDGPVSGTAVQVMVNFACCVGTLETGVTTGLARRGRLYMPTAPGTIGSTLVASEALAMAESYSALLHQISEGDGGVATGFIPAVFSPVNADVNPVTGVSCDCIIDAQVRRKRQLIPFRQLATYTPA